MKSQEIYRAWKRARQQVDIRPEFSAELMDRITRCQVRRATSWSGLRARMERMAARPWAKAAAIGIAALIGVGRALLTLHVLLFA